MKCDSADSLLHSYFDGELSALGAAEFELHLHHCGDCSAELVSQDFLSRRLQLARLYEPAPVSLRRKISAALRPVAPTPAASRPLLWHWLAAAALLLVALTLWRVSPDLDSDDYQVELADEIVDAHLRSLQPGRMTGIASNDQQAVKRWFKHKVKVVLPVRDFANDGFAMQGGRLDVIEGHSFAALVYAHRGRSINVFIWPAPKPDAAPRIGSRKGYHWIDWRKGEIEFCAVSDADPVDLEQLQQLIAE